MFKNTFEKFVENMNDDVSVVLYGKKLIDELEELIEKSSKNILENKEIGSYRVEDCNKILNVLMKKSASIDVKVIDELSDAEIRKTYKVSEKALKDLGKKDLIEKYKTITETKSIKVENIKG